MYKLTIKNRAGEKNKKNYRTIGLRPQAIGQSNIGLTKTNGWPDLYIFWTALYRYAYSLGLLYSMHVAPRSRLIPCAVSCA
jgi:hypothetical protein